MKPTILLMKLMRWKSKSVETETAAVVEVEEIKVVTKLTMASRKLKIKISNELLFELENAN
jgi:DNA polymerase-3 subunit alpha